LNLANFETDPGVRLVYLCIWHLLY